MKYFLLKSELVIHPRAFLRVPDSVPEHIVHRYLKGRGLVALEVPHAILRLSNVFGNGNVRKIKMSTPNELFITPIECENVEQK